VHDGVDVMDGLGRKPAAAVGPPRRKELEVEAVQIRGAEIVKRHLSEAREHVVGEVCPIALPGRGPDRRPDDGKPLGDELGESFG